MTEKNFVNGLKLEKKEFDNGGMIIKCGAKVDDLIEYLKKT